MSRMFLKTFLVILSVIFIVESPDMLVFADSEEEPFEIIKECDFEDESILDSREWYAFGDGNSQGASLKAVIISSLSHSGNSCMKVSGRSQKWMGPGTDIFKDLEAGFKYNISLYARHDYSMAMDMHLVAKIVKNGAEKYIEVTKNDSVKPDEWVELSGDFWLPSGCSSVELYIDSGKTGCNIYADDYVLKKCLVDIVYGVKNPEEYGKPIVTWDFEDNNLDTWKDNGVSSLVLDKIAYEGNNSLRIRNGRAQKGGCSVSLQPYYDPAWKGNFYLTGYIYSGGAENEAQTFTVSQITQNNNGIEKTEEIDSITIFPDTWVGFVSELNLNEDTQIVYISISGPEIISFNLDKVSFTTDAELPRDNEENYQDIDRMVSSFEKDNDMWFSKDGARIVRTDEYSKKGSYSLLVDSRESAKCGVSLFLNMLEKEEYYHYSCYIRYDGEDVTKTHDFYIQAETLKDGKKVYSTIGHGTAKKGKWCKINGVFRVPLNQNNINCVISSTDYNLDSDYAISFYVDNIDICREDIYKAGVITKILLIFLILVVIFIIIIFIVRKRIKSTEKIKSSKIDSMTKAYNRNTYEEFLKEYEMHPEKCAGLYFAVCDLNHLKYINDNYGHSFGDDAIMRCSSLLLRACGSSHENKVYRIGGDEFVVISAKNIRAEINMEIRKEQQIQKNYPFSVAVGYSTYNTIEDGEIPNISNIIKRADEEMYKVKEKMKKEDNIGFDVKSEQKTKTDNN